MGGRREGWLRKWKNEGVGRWMTSSIDRKAYWWVRGVESRWVDRWAVDEWVAR